MCAYTYNIQQVWKGWQECVNWVGYKVTTENNVLINLGKCS